MHGKVHVKFALAWESQTAFHVGSGTGGAGFVDRFVQRRGDGALIIPATSLKGNSRSQATAIFRRWSGDQLCDKQREKRTGQAVDGAKEPCNCPLCLLYGVSGLQPGTIKFGDLRSTSGDEIALRWNVSLDNVRHTAIDGLLATSEVGCAGQTLTGSCEGYLPENVAWGDSYTVDYRGLIGLLALSLLMAQSFGGGKTRGLGQGRMRLTLTLTRPGGTPEAISEDELKGWCRQWICS